MQAYGQLGPDLRSVFALIIGTLGAIQISRIASKKVPKYKEGRKGGKEEMAIVGDGGVHEVVESKDGLAYMTPDTYTLVKLNEGDTVHKSVDDYHKSLQKTMISKMSKDTENYLDQTKKDTLLLEEIKENTKQMRELQRILKSKKMTTTVNLPKIDLAHAAWLNKNR